MAFRDLEQELQELFSQSQLDRFDREGISVHNLEQDKEARLNYQRWYKKQVLYPRHKERYRLIAKQWYWYHKLMQDDQWRKKLEGWRRKNKLQNTRGTKQYKAKLEYLKRWKRKKKETDPDYVKRCRELHKASYQRKKNSPGWKAKKAEYNRRYRERLRDGKKTASSS